MPPKSFSTGEAVRFGWTTVTRNLGFFVLVMVIYGLAYVIPETFRRSGADGGSGPAGIIGLAFVVIQIIISMGVIKIALRFYDGQQPELSDLFNTYPLFFRYLFTGILYGLIVAVGIVLLVVPGVIWAIRFAYAPFLVVDRGLRPLEALGKSSAITSGVKWPLFLFGLVLLGINILGALVLLIGLIVTVPTTFLAGASVYRRLLSQTEAPPPAAQVAA